VHDGHDRNKPGSDLDDDDVGQALRDVLAGARNPTRPAALGKKPQ
jgi:hypothetical protein